MSTDKTATREEDTNNNRKLALEVLLELVPDLTDKNKVAVSAIKKPLIQQLNVITGPTQPVGIGAPRTFPKTGGAIKFLTEQNPNTRTHVLKVFNINSPFGLVEEIDLTAPMPLSTGEYSKQVNLPNTTVGTTYWFELGLKIVNALDVEHRVHRVRVTIT